MGFDCLLIRLRRGIMGGGEVGVCGLTCFYLGIVLEYDGLR